MFLCEGLHGGIRRRAVLLGPLPPMLRIAVVVQQRGVQRFEAAVIFQCLAAGLTEAGKVGLKGIAASGELLIERAQQTAACFGNSSPVDQLQLFELLQLSLDSTAFYRLA